MSPKSLAIMKGTLDVLVLKALTWSAMHGFEITAWLEQHSSGSLEVEDSALYQALYDDNADLILSNGRIATQDERRSFVNAVAIKDGRFLAVGDDQDVLTVQQVGEEQDGQNFGT